MILTTGKRLVARMLNKRRAKPDPPLNYPEVTLVIAAYNEAEVIEEKIANCLNLDYPSDKLSFLFITDGSNDGTDQIIARYPQIRLLHQPERKGKSAALNRAMKYVTTPITVFCDANTILNRPAITRIAMQYNNKRVGGVAGEKKIRVVDGSTTGSGEGLYWRYESLLKRLDARLYTVTGAAGELFSIRTDLWEPLPENAILDDFVISSRINLKGYKIGYEPTAYATELPSSTIKEEKKRKVRISAGAFQAMSWLKPLFNVYKHPLLFFQFFSHRFLRWTLTPLAFPTLLISNSLMVFIDGGTFFAIALLLQGIFYLFALIGAFFRDSNRRLPLLKVCYYIVFMNYSVYLGFFRFLKGEQTVVWDKALRQNVLSSAV
jgi:cellulose synthase/poly-beta-1,6-N-acetylglucosamine synthase-like glycosyltransferase